TMGGLFAAKRGINAVRGMKQVYDFNKGLKNPASNPTGTWAPNTLPLGPTPPSATLVTPQANQRKSYLEGAARGSLSGVPMFGAGKAVTGPFNQDLRMPYNRD